MESIVLNTDVELLDQLFPFYLILNDRLEIASMGRSMHKLYPQARQSCFTQAFTVKRPQKEITCAKDLAELDNALVIIETNHLEKTLLLRGTFHYRERDDIYLFAGSPWFASADELFAHSLTLHDFAVQDPMIDFLHVLKNQEIATDETKQLLHKVKDQKNELIRSEAKYRAIVETAAEIIYKVNEQGRIIFINETAERITGYEIHELLQMQYDELAETDFRQMAIDFYNAQIANRTATSYLEYPILTKNGKKIWLGQSAQLSVNEHDKCELTFVSIDISLRRKVEEKLFREEEKYRNIIANINLGLMEVDNDDRVQYVNQSFCEMSGYSMSEILGNKASSLILDENGKKFIDEQFEKRKKGDSDVYPLPVRRKDGGLRWWLISGAPRYNDKGELVGSVGIHLDITDQKRLEAELKLAKQKAEESSKAKENFLATMSHEIRTPLNAIIGIAELMKMNAANRNEDNMDTLCYSAKNLLALITDILDISKIDSGKIELTSTPVHLPELLHRICQVFQQGLENNELDVVLHQSPALPKVVLGDELRLTQILNNLISNAIKFTPKGQVTISAAAENTQEGRVRINFMVQDTGIGIKKKDLTRIFEAFEQADQGKLRKYGGTGLGLNITKKLLELLGGKISVASKPGIGTTFSFSLDFEVYDQQLTDTSQHHGAQRLKPDALKGKNILLVEDNVINQKVVGSFFIHWGMHHDIANNGKEALAHLAAKNYDLVILDLFMPVMDGFETLKILRKDPSQKTLPVIALTASAEVPVMEKAIKQGANKCLTKPFNSQELFDAMSTLLEPRPPKLKVSGSAPVVEVKQKHVIDIKLIEEASMGSKEFIAEMLELIYTQLPELISEAGAYYEKNEMRDFALTIHKAKYNILLLGLNSLKKDLVFIESASTEPAERDNVGLAFKRIKDLVAKAILELGNFKVQYEQYVF